MNTWTKEDVIAINTNWETTRVFYHNEMLFFRPDNSIDDEMHTELYALAGSGGGAIAMALNIDYLKEVAAAGVSQTATEIISLIGDAEGTITSIIMIDPIYQLGSDAVQFIIAHELGHIVNGHTANDGIDGIALNQPSELVADAYALDLLGTLDGLKAYFKFVIERMAFVNMAIDVREVITNALRARAIVILPEGDYHEEDYKLRAV